ncbi:hypothetical protein [Cereibacter sphaeroides]|uniref:hypothetical protein n=1 Tax=Cereibacter sphaeroides TaxID=1063 RepID=UPI000F525E96|nr:hypothetical protein [Cereibacter sphaeroides]AZB58701.1 hypothetical protein EBL88_03570 [Cereibacter sphaeroides]
MGLKPGAAVWGKGEILRSPADAGQAGGGVPDQADRLAEMDAAEAIATLEGADFAVQMPDVAAFTFPGPTAELLYWSDADIVGIQGPVGSGKTTTVLKSRLRRAVMMPRSTIDLEQLPDGRVVGWRRYKLLVVRETYRQLWSTTIPSYLEVYPKALGTWSGGRGDPVTHVIQFDDGEGPIEFRVEFMAFGDDVIASMRGVQTTDIWLNETDTVPVEVLTAGIGRIDRWPGASHFEGYPPELRGYGQICADFNAPDEDNWTFTVFHNEDERRRMADAMTAGLPEGARPIRIEFYNQPGYGQPGCENLHNLSASYYPRQIAAMRLAGRGDMIDRLVYNKIVYLRAGDPVFKREFNRRIHVAESTIEPERGVPLRIGLDQGFKGAAIVAQFVPPFHWLFLAELHFPAERLMAATFGQRLADLLERRFPGLEVEGGWADMAGEHGASQAADENDTWNKLVGEAAGFRVRPQKVGTNRIQPRLEAMRAALEFIHGGRPGLLIDPSCKFTIRGFEARYVWKDEVDANGDKRKVPDKSLTEANVMDAGQYVLLSESKPSGLSKFSFPGAAAAASGTGPGSRRPQPAGGLLTGYDVFNPYGD